MADDVTLTRLESSVIALRGTVDEFRAEQERRWQRIEPLIMERSGDLGRMQRIEVDLNHLGDKHRQLAERVGDFEIRSAARVSGVEKRQDRTGWMVIGGFAVLQFLWMVAQPIVERLLGR